MKLGFSKSQIALAALATIGSLSTLPTAATAASAIGCWLNADFKWLTPVWFWFGVESGHARQRR